MLECVQEMEKNKGSFAVASNSRTVISYTAYTAIILMSSLRLSWSKTIACLTSSCEQFCNLQAIASV